MRAKNIFLVLLLSIICGCASVPKEVVELSYYVGNDLKALQESYDTLIHDFYEQLRARRLDYLRSEWTPLFIELMVKEEKLVEVAKGELVWSEEENDFVAPTPGREYQQLLYEVCEWSKVAIDMIQVKRNELVTPLYAEEDSVRSAVRDAFHNLIRANEAITQHLNSIRKVHDLQDDVLSKMKIKELRDEINEALTSASRKAAKVLEEEKKVGVVIDAIIPESDETDTGEEGP